jgi:hypothetical protein
MGSYSFESMAMLIGNMINYINGTLGQSTFRQNHRKKPSIRVDYSDPHRETKN